MSFATLECDRLAVTLKLTGERERGEALARELAGALESRLGDELARLGDAAGDGYLFIDRLEVEGAVCGDWNLDALVRMAARRISEAIERAQSVGVARRFADATEYLAAYLSAASQGRIQSDWCFREFQGLESLSTSNALRTAILQDVGRGIAALARLTPASASEVLRAMVAGDVQRVLEVWSMHDAPDKPCLETLWRHSSHVRDGAPGALVAALLAGERASAGSLGQVAVRYLRELVTLRSTPSADLSDDVALLRSEFRTWLVSLGQTCTWLDAASDAQVSQIARDIAVGSHANPTAVRQWTPFGGLIALWHTLSRLGWLSGWEQTLGSERARLLALAVAAQALSPRQSLRVLNDPGWLEALGLESPLPTLRRARDKYRAALDSVATTETSVSDEPLEPCRIMRGALGAALSRTASRLLREFAQGIPGLAGSSPIYLRERVLDGDARWTREQERVRVWLGRATLDVLLVLAGRKSGEFVLPGGIHIVYAGEVG